MTELPERVARHFPERIDPGDPGAPAAVVARLLEDGDRADLVWLATQVGLPEIAAWFDRHGARRLSRRSRAFWAVVLDREPGGRPSTLAPEALWPLA